jgi:hypothetical protein
MEEEKAGVVVGVGRAAPKAKEGGAGVGAEATAAAAAASGRDDDGVVLRILAFRWTLGDCGEQGRRRRERKMWFLVVRRWLQYGKETMWWSVRRIERKDRGG